MWKEFLWWLRAPKQERDRAEFAHGYQYAAGELLQTPTEGMAAHLYSEAHAAEMLTHYDLGIMHAVADFKSLRTVAA